MTTNDIEKVEIIPLYEIIKNQQAKQYEYVDLGLPSGLKWAKCNVGAEKITLGQLTSIAMAAVLL